MNKFLIWIIFLLNISNIGYCQKIGNDLFEFNETFGKPTLPMFEHEGVSIGQRFKDGFLTVSTLQNKVIELQFNYQEIKKSYQDKLITEYEKYLPDDSELIDKTDISKGAVKGITFIYQSKKLQVTFQQPLKTQNIIIEIYYNIESIQLIEVVIKCFPRKKDYCLPNSHVKTHNLNLRFQKDKRYKEKQVLESEKLQKKNKNVGETIYDNIMSSHELQLKPTKEELLIKKFKEKSNKLILETLSYSFQNKNLLPSQIDKYKNLINKIESTDTSDLEALSSLEIMHIIYYLKINLANLFLTLEEYKKALEIYLLVIDDKENPQYRNGLDGAATCYYFISTNRLKAKKYKEALSNINNAIQINNNFTEFFLLRSEIYKKLEHEQDFKSDKNTAKKLSKMNIDISSYFKQYILKMKKS